MSARWHLQPTDPQLHEAAARLHRYTSLTPATAAQIDETVSLLRAIGGIPSAGVPRCFGLRGLLIDRQALAARCHRAYLQTATPAPGRDA